MVRTHALQPVEVKSLWTIFFIFFRRMNAVIGWVEWIIRMGGELYHGEIGDVYEMFAVVVALIYREALFNRTDVIVLCAPYLGLEGTVAEVAHNHAVFAVLLEARARLHAGDFVEARRGFCGFKNARLLKQTGSEVIVDGLHQNGQLLEVSGSDSEFSQREAPRLWAALTRFLIVIKSCHSRLESSMRQSDMPPKRSRAMAEM